MRPIIIAIVGASGSGKTTLSKYLQRKYGIPAIVSTTTRPRREGEVEGEDYFFVRSTRGIGREAMLTYTRFGKHEYFSLRRQLPESAPSNRRPERSTTSLRSTFPAVRKIYHSEASMPSVSSATATAVRSITP